MSYNNENMSLQVHSRLGLGRVRRWGGREGSILHIIIIIVSLRRCIIYIYARKQNSQIK